MTEGDVLKATYPGIYVEDTVDSTAAPGATVTITPAGRRVTLIRG